MPSESSRAIFLSYASQDAGAARRISDALRADGIEVWFDADGGLEHGDAWDAKIRRQIKECVLFIPLISASTQAREEGYFRLEWDLAAERARTIAAGVPFILPVIIDDTREPDALVPDRFRSVQWTRLRGGEVPADVRARLVKLWSQRIGGGRSEPASMRPPERVDGTPQSELMDVSHRARGPRFAAVIAALAVLVVVGALLVQWRRTTAPTPEPSKPNASPGSVQHAAPSAPGASTAVSEARQLATKARALFELLDGTRDDYKLAEEYITQAKAKEPMDAEVWAVEAQLHERYLVRGWDVSDARREATRIAAQRAIRIDPQSFEARLAQLGLLADTGPDAAEKERRLRDLRRERPTDHRVLRSLGIVLDRSERLDEAAAVYDESAALPGGDPLALYNKSLANWFAGRTNEAESAIRASVAQQPFTGARLIAAWYRTALHGDLDGARNLIGQISPAEMLEDRAAFFAFYIELLARRADPAIARLAAVPRDWVNDFWYRGPKGLLVGDALEIGGRHDAAMVEWTTALTLVDQRLAANPNNDALLYNRTRLLARLGRREEAERQFQLLRQMRGVDAGGSNNALERGAKCYALLGHKAEAIQNILAGLKLREHAVLFPSGELRLDPIYDGLRGEPKFAQAIAEAEAIEKGDMPAPTPNPSSRDARPR